MTTYLETYDSDNLYEWHKISEYFDADSLLIQRDVLFDDTSTKLSVYTNGALSYSKFSDLGAQNSKPWETIEKWFGRSGELVQLAKVLDNGISVSQHYTDGVLAYEKVLDAGAEGTPSAVKPWEQIEKWYDTSGDLIQWHRQNDDGTQQQNRFENGVLTYSAFWDVDDSGGPSSVKAWESIEIYYDTQGLRVQRNEVLDNGVTIENRYENGVLQTKEMRDKGPSGEVSDVKEWDTILFRYDQNGQLEKRETFYDNGDVVMVFFEEGVKSLRVERDGDDDFPWLYRIKEFDDAGEFVSASTYRHRGQLPDEYETLIEPDIFIVA